MPRPPRLHVPGGCYHAILRGNHQDDVFTSPTDREVLNDIVADALDHTRARLHAFCWMTNHLHFVVQIADQPLGSTMKRIAMRYSRYRHRRLQTTGHLFERRYRAKLVDVDAYFLALLRYVHLNPVKAGLVTDPADYPWSSHRAFLGQVAVPWLTVEFGLSLFSKDLARARLAYRRFLACPMDDIDVIEVANGSDTRVLGSHDFIARISTPPHEPKREITLEQLAAEICARENVGLDLVRSRSSARNLSATRWQILQEALDRRVATLTEVARYLDRDPSTLCKLVPRRRREVEASKPALPKIQ